MQYKSQKRVSTNEKKNNKNAVQDKSERIRESINKQMNVEQVTTTSTPESMNSTFIVVEVWTMDIVESINNKMKELQLH